MCAVRFGQRAGNPDREERAGLRADPVWTRRLAQPRLEPIPTGIHANDQPDPRPARVAEKCNRQRRVFDMGDTRLVAHNRLLGLPSMYSLTIGRYFTNRERAKTWLRV